MRSVCCRAFLEVEREDGRQYEGDTHKGGAEGSQKESERVSGTGRCGIAEGGGDRGKATMQSGVGMAHDDGQAM